MPDAAAIPAADRKVLPSDNMPPRERFTERVKERVGGVNAWAARGRIRTKEEAGKCEDLRKQLRDERADVDAQRKAEKKPHDEAAAEVQHFYAELIDLLDTAYTVLGTMRSAWLRLEEMELEEQRRAAEEAARKAEEEARAKAAAAAAAADAGDEVVEATMEAAAAADRAQEAADAARRAAAAKPQVVGEISGRASGFRTEWYATVTDWKAATAALSEHPWVRDAVQRAANSAAKATKSATKIGGVEVKSRKV